MQWIFILLLALLIVGCIVLSFYKLGKFKKFHKPKIIIYKRGSDKIKTDEG